MKLDGETSLRELLTHWFVDLKNRDTYERKYLALLEDVGASFQWVEDDDPEKLCFVCFGGDTDEAAQTVATYVGAISTMLHWLSPDDFVPYYFEGRYSEFSEICRTFGIDFEKIPGKLQKQERALFYLKINAALQEYRHLNQWSARELNAFLYDFAPRYLVLEKDKELLPPQRAWFLMAGVGTASDFDFLDGATNAVEGQWRGHRDARRGDIAIMWCSSPRAYLHSIWRVVEDGYDDPFAHWYTLVSVGSPIFVPHLKIADLKSNPILEKSPMVRAHFQGCSGKYFRPVDYEALLDVIQRRGTTIDNLPKLTKLELPVMTEGVQILDERQVELQLIEPLLLKRLGYAEKNQWRRQVCVRMGRGENVYPDYVIGYRGDKGEERADIIIESKYRIATKKELDATFLQGRSYALRLQASWLLFAALEGVWLLNRTDDFKLKDATHWSWEKLVQPENFLNLESLIGSRVFSMSK